MFSTHLIKEWCSTQDLLSLCYSISSVKEFMLPNLPNQKMIDFIFSNNINNFYNINNLARCRLSTHSGMLCNLRSLADYLDFIVLVCRTVKKKKQTIKKK